MLDPRLDPDHRDIKFTEALRINTAATLGMDSDWSQTDIDAHPFWTEIMGKKEWAPRVRAQVRVLIRTSPY